MANGQMKRYLTSLIIVNASQNHNEILPQTSQNGSYTKLKELRTELDPETPLLRI